MLTKLTDRTNYLLTPVPPNTPNSYRFHSPRKYFRLVQCDFKGQPNHPFLRSLTGKPWSTRDDRQYGALERMQFAVPLSYNHRKRNEDRNNYGAVLVDPDKNIGIRKNAQIVLLYDYERGELRDSMMGDFQELEAMYVGTLPETITDQLFNGERIMTDNLLFESEYIRGPRVEVSVHHREPIDLDPQHVTFAQLKELSLANIAQFNQLYGVDILAMEPDDLFAQLAIRHSTLDPDRAQIQAIRTTLSTNAYNLFYYNWKDDDKRVLFPTYGEEPGTLSYFNGYTDFIRGRETVAKAGKVIRKLSESSSDATVKSLVDRILIAQLPDDFYLLESSREIVNAYRNGPNSCTSKDMSCYSRLRKHGITDEAFHPVSVYGDESDVKMMVLKKGDRIMARALVVPEKMKHIVIYPKEYSTRSAEEAANHALRDHLEELGYRRDPEAIVGCLLNMRQLPGAEEFLAYPYVDEGSYPSIVLEDALIVYRNGAEGQLDNALTTRARAKLIETFGTQSTMTFDRMHASHDYGADRPEPDRVTLSMLNGTFGKGQIVKCYENLTEYTERFSESLSGGEYYCFYNNQQEMVYYERSFINQNYKPLSSLVKHVLEGKWHKSFAGNYILPEDYNKVFELDVIERDGFLYLRAEFIEFDGREIPIDRCYAYKMPDGTMQAIPQDARVDLSTYIRSINTNAPQTEGAQHESEAA